MSWDKNRRTEAILKEKIAVIVTERLSDPRLGFVTITDVKLSKDKRHARVLFTVLGTPVQRRLSERALADARGHVLEVLGRTLKMRSLPELRFVYDESIEREARMLDLLDHIAAERGDGSLADVPETGTEAEAEPGDPDRPEA